jgi:hypothetical protein
MSSLFMEKSDVGKLEGVSHCTLQLNMVHLPLINQAEKNDNVSDTLCSPVPSGL